MYPTLTVLSA